MSEKQQREPMLAEFLDIDAMAAEAEAERPSENESMLSEFLDMDPAPVAVTGRATQAQIDAERVRRDVADRLGVSTDPGAK